jgi:DSF synthase
MNAVADIRYLSKPQLGQVETRFDEEFGVYWALMSPRSRPCFTQELLSDLRTYIDSIQNGGGVIWHKGTQHTIQYGVLASKVPGVFNLGGDLALFRTLIEARDLDGLMRYGIKCIDDLYPWYRNSV